jgi:hypothetical protein
MTFTDGDGLPTAGERERVAGCVREMLASVDVHDAGGMPLGSAGRS